MRHRVNHVPGIISKLCAAKHKKVAYDGNNQLTSITYPSGRVVTYGRWPNGQIKNVKASFTGGPEVTVVSLVANKPFGEPQSIYYGNGLVQIRDTDTAGSPFALSLVDASTFEALDFHSFTVSDAGNVMQDADDLQNTYTRNYNFDALDRLTFDSGASVADPTYTYDANGNRLRREAGAFAEQDFTYLPGSNRQSATQYDGMGNKQESYATYNESGRLGYLSDAVTADTLVLAYNGLGELARTVMYHPDPCSVEQLLLSRDDYLFLPDGRALSIHQSNTASVNTDYVWVDGLPVAQFVDSYDAEDELIGTTLTYLHPDHLGTPRIGTSQGKAITWRYRSDAFGIPDAQTSGLVRLRFPGQISLGVAGVHYNYFRDYEAADGRYLESDPIGLAGGLNTYAYVGGNPIRHNDPFGLMCTAELGCYTTPAEAAAAQSGNYQGYYQLACVGGDAYACFAGHVAANDDFWGHRATNRVLDKLRKKAQAAQQCLNEDGILNQLRVDLAKDYASYLPNSQDRARWPSIQDVAHFHWNEFSQIGLPQDTFGGTPFGQNGPLVSLPGFQGPFFLPGTWCPNCTL